MEHERLTYPEAIEWLANRANMKIPETFESTEYRERKELKEKIYNANKEAAKFYFDNLFSPKGEEALTYLRNRGLSEQTLTTFGIGFSSNSYDLPQYMEKKGYDKQTLKKAGLAGIDEEKKRSYDFFSYRIIVPIIDAMGKVIGFGGRVLKDAGFAKYKNTMASLAFDKSKSLYNINLLKKIKQTEPMHSAILVEGYMDVISLYQEGIKNTVAPMGTSLTIEQCKMLKRYVDLVYVCFDGDSAGQNAALRSLDLLKQSGLEVKVVDLPDKMDPDDAVKKLGVDGFMNLVTNALPLIDFKLKKAEESFDMNTFDGKSKYALSAIEVLSSLDAVEQEVYASKVSQKSGLAKDTILAQCSGKQLQNKATQSIKKIDDTAPIGKKGMVIAANFVLSSVLNIKSYVDFTQLNEDFFEESLHKSIYNYILECIDKSVRPKISDIFDLTEEKTEVTELVDTLENIANEKQESYYNECYLMLHKNYQSKRMQSLAAKLQTEKDPTKIELFKKQISELIKSQTR